MGSWGEMATRKNEHQSKWAFGANGLFGANRYMVQMSIESMWGLGQINIWINGHFGVKGHFGTNEHWGKWAFGA